MRELIVSVANPSELDKTVQQLGGFVGQKSDGSYDKVFAKNMKRGFVVRSLSGYIGYLKFAIKEQGYGTIIEERDIS